MSTTAEQKTQTGATDEVKPGVVGSTGRTTLKRPPRNGTSKSKKSEAASLTQIGFNEYFDVIPDILPYDFNWQDDLGFFDPAVTDRSKITLQPGQVANTTALDDGRKVIFIGTNVGLIAIYQKHASNSKILGTSVSRGVRMSKLFPLSIHEVVGENSITYEVFSEETVRILFGRKEEVVAPQVLPQNIQDVLTMISCLCGGCQHHYQF